MHVPVMLDECLQYLAIQPEETYLDATTGLGGHTSAIAQRLSSGRVIANDRDAQSLQLARDNTSEWSSRICYHHGPFSRLQDALRSCGVNRVHGVLADLGVSRFQLTEPERGFSLMADGPLDMRMDRSQGTPASDLVNFASEKELADLIYQLGEERRSRRITRAIVRARPVHSTLQLAQIVEQAVPRTGKLHPATQTFMALRMAVNDELGELDQFLSTLPDLILPGGRIVIITFTSLEDRPVKRRFQELARSGRVMLLTKHVVKPTDEEVMRNPPSRSAKLRVAEMK